MTDRIETFTATGIRLASGDELEADVIVTATGLRLQAFGGIEMYIDGERVDIPKKIAFRGLMLDGIPNFAFLIGYTNASWTLKVGLVCDTSAGCSRAWTSSTPTPALSSCRTRTWTRGRC